MKVRSDRWFRFGVGPEWLWSALTSVDRYRHWWPWLRRFEPEPGSEGPFSAGARWRCTVRSPLLFRLRFDIVLDEVVAGRLVAATVSGDISGHAHLDVVPAEGGSRLRLVSALAASSWPLRTVARLAPSLARFGHDRLLDLGARQLSSKAFDPGRGWQRAGRGPRPLASPADGPGRM